MILVDTSIWVEHFRGRPRAEPLVRLLEDDEALLHPWVLGELSLGNLGDPSSEVRKHLDYLPTPDPVAPADVLEMVDSRGLAGTGVGWVDAQLLATALVTGSSLWTFDRRLAEAARTLDVFV